MAAGGAGKGGRARAHAPRSAGARAHRLSPGCAPAGTRRGGLAREQPGGTGRTRPLPAAAPEHPLLLLARPRWTLHLEALPRLLGIRVLVSEPKDLSFHPLGLQSLGPQSSSTRPLHPSGVTSKHLSDLLCRVEVMSGACGVWKGCRDTAHPHEFGKQPRVAVLVLQLQSGGLQRDFCLKGLLIYRRNLSWLIGL